MVRSLTVDETNNLMLGQYGVCFLNVRPPIIATITASITIAGVMTVNSINTANNTSYTGTTSLPSGSRISGGSGATLLPDNTYLVNTNGIYQLYIADDSSNYGSATTAVSLSGTSNNISYTVYYGWGATQGNANIDNDKYKILTTSGIDFTTTIAQGGRNYGGGRAWRALMSPSNMTFSTIQCGNNTAVTFSNIDINKIKLFPTYPNGGNYDYITLQGGQTINGNITSFEARNSSTVSNMYFLAYVNPKYL